MGSSRRLPNQEPQLLSPCSSGRRSNDSNSPEFEFWMVRNPSFPQPNLHSADELFVDGVLLPLHLLKLQDHQTDPPRPQPDPEPPNSQSEQETEPEPGPGPKISPAAITAEPTTTLTSSKRWKDIFKIGDKKTAMTKNQDEKEKEKEKKRKKRSQSGASSAELNINIWPFSRSRSAGNGETRPKMFPGALGTRKVSSAPCSRSNSAGESKSRKWPNSPSRAGVHLGRSSPVWQVRRGGGSSASKSSYIEPAVRSTEKAFSKKEDAEPSHSKRANCSNSGTGSGGGGAVAASKPRILNVNVNVPMCIGHRHRLSCRSHENSAIAAGGNGKVRSGSGGDNGNSTAPNVRNGGNIFNFRSLFPKKVY